MSRPDVDIAILGGGCAGLSLAARLAIKGRSVRVIEPRNHYINDRTWSFWRTAPDPFEDCVRASWDQWDISGVHGSVRRRSSVLRYQTISSAAFYERAQMLIADGPAADLSLGIAATAVFKTDRAWRIDTDAGALTANHVIDTRPSRDIPKYGQFFLGKEIRTSRPVFDPSLVNLMHFRRSRSGGVDFVYRLPFARDRALVEVTTFAPVSPGGAVFETWLDEEIDRLDTGGFEVLHFEGGALPMQVGFGEQRRDGVLRMGLGGGAARASTGYAFARIQAQADRIADALTGGFSPQTQLDGLATRFMDRVFLQVLRSAPERAPTLFESLFRNVSEDRLERFLSGSTHPVDRFSVMSSLPKLPFMRAALFPA